MALAPYVRHSIGGIKVDMYFGLGTLLLVLLLVLLFA